MKIGLLGTEEAGKELQSIEGFKGEVSVFSHPSDMEKALRSLEMVLIFPPLPDDDSFIDAIGKFNGLLGLNSIYGSSLSQMLGMELAPSSCFSFIGLNGFLNRKDWELGIPFEKDTEKIIQAFEKMGISASAVRDRAGLSSARVIGMIVNEAYFTVMEGTSEKEDIDTAMKLGTNYPFGPFELVKKAGVENFLILMESLYEENRDDRYKPCPLLREEALKATVS